MSEVQLPEDLTDKFPSNSFSQKRSNNAKRKKKKPVVHDYILENENTTEKRKPRVETVCKAQTKKQSLIKKLGKTIIEDSIESVKERAFNEIIVPGLKTLLFDTITDMADAMLFGNSGYSKGYSSRRDRDHTSYSNYYEKKNRKSKRSIYDYDDRMTDYSMEPDDIKVNSRREGEKALREVEKCIKKYGHASIADLYDAVGTTSDWTDDQYGWYDIRGAKLRPIRGGKYLIIMPPTEELD